MNSIQMSSPFHSELEVAREAARRAGRLIRDRAGADQVREKGRADLVTAVDEASERLIRSIIAEHFPEDFFVAEEFSPDARAGDIRRWIVDPVDGTVNFVHGFPFTAVSIAFADADGVAVGVIEAPSLGETFWAVRGGGAFLNESRIAVSDVADPGGSLFATGFPFKGGKGQPGPYFEMVTDILLQSHGIRRAGAAALDLAYVACGRLDGFFEIGLSPWDVAAGILLVEEAGGRVTGWPGDAETPLLSGRVLASNGRVHQWLWDRTATFADRLSGS